jgi:hypothetical protein
MNYKIYSGVKPFSSLTSILAVARQVVAGTRPPRTKEMDGLKLTDVQWESIVAAWDQEPSQRPGLSSSGEPMIFSWRPETAMVYSVNHQPDLTAHEAMDALLGLSWLMRGVYRGKHNGFSQDVFKIFSLVFRSGCIPIRRHEDTLLRSIYERVPPKHALADYDSPYFKIFLLLQAHFSRLPLSPELSADLSIVLERIFSLFSVCAHWDWFNFDSDLAVSPLQILPLMRMCVHGMWDHDPELKQIPHFEDDVSCSINRPGLWLIHASGYRPFR